MFPLLTETIEYRDTSDGLDLCKWIPQNQSTRIRPDLAEANNKNDRNRSTAAARSNSRRRRKNGNAKTRTARGEDHDRGTCWGLGRDRTSSLLIRRLCRAHLRPGTQRLACQDGPQWRHGSCPAPVPRTRCNENPLPRPWPEQHRSRRHT